MSVSGVPASLSTCGVFGVSPPELASYVLAGVRGSHAFWTCGGKGNGLDVLELSCEKKNGRLSGSRSRFGVVKAFLDGDSRTEWGPNGPKSGHFISMSLSILKK